jgi:hypothetical protein
MQFDVHCINMGTSEPILTKELYDGSCVKLPYESDRSHRLRIRVLRRFAVFLETTK